MIDALLLAATLALTGPQVYGSPSAATPSVYERWTQAAAAQKQAATPVIVVPQISAPVIHPSTRAVALAFGDLSYVASKYDRTACQVRYLSLNDPTLTLRLEKKAAVDLLLNYVSRSPGLRRTVQVDPECYLLRVDLFAYIDPFSERTAFDTFVQLFDAWEAFAPKDRKFYLQTEVLDHGKLKVKTIPFGFLGLDTFAKLQRLTCTEYQYGGRNFQSEFPIASADAFIGLVARTNDVGDVTGGDYYDFAGISESFDGELKNGGIDRAAVERQLRDLRANLSISAVTLKPRMLFYLPGPSGGFWFSLDTLVESPDADPFRIPFNTGAAVLRFDAIEVFRMANNGLWKVSLFNGRGVRQQSVPDRIAKDSQTPDGIIYPGISCWRCHETKGGTAGLQPFEDVQHSLRLDNYTTDPIVGQRILFSYTPKNLNRALNADAQAYAESIDRVTGGLSTYEAVTTLSKCFAEFQYTDVTLARAAREVGTVPALAAVAWEDSNDPALIRLVAGKKVTRATFEVAYQEASLRALNIKFVSPERLKP